MASWLILTLLSAVALGLYDVSKKTAVADNAVLEVLALSSASGLCLLGLELALAQMVEGDLGITLVTLSAQQHGLVLLKAAIVSLSWVCSYFAIKHLPISVASPVRAGAPVFTLLGSLLLFEERPTLQQWVGICIVAISYFAFSVIGKREGIHFTRNRWVAALFVGTLIGSGSALYDKYLLQVAALPPFTLQLWFTIYGVAIQALLVGVFRRQGAAPSAPLELRWAIPLVGCLLVVADQLYFQALAESGALISVVSVVRRSNVVVSFVVGSVLFHELHRRAKACALLGVLCGLWLLVRA